MNSEVKYADLEHRTKVVSHLLAHSGVRKGDRVGIFMNRCLETAYAIYGIMNLGAVYVPLDVSSPKSRIDFQLEDCGISVLLTTSSQRRRIVNLGIPVEALEVDKIDWDNSESRSLEAELKETDPAYIIYTSGSTGTPKGIVHSHKSGLAYARLTLSTFGIHSGDRIANHAPIFFDISTLGYFSGPLAGACTCIATDAHTVMPASLLQWVSKEEITMWYSVPLALTQMMDTKLLSKHLCPKLRWVFYAGEPFPVNRLRKLMLEWKQSKFCNIYGPTETNQCTHYIFTQIPEVNAAIPIGMVWDETDYIVVEEELYIKSSTVMIGYWNNPELTGDSFYIQQSDEGREEKYYMTGDLVEVKNDLLYLKGRKDHQIKIRGFRVELAEIEKRVLEYEGIENCCVLPRIVEGKNEALVAFLISSAAIDWKNIVKFLKGKLPHYAVPAEFMLKQDFPNTPSGKTDRKALQKELENRA